MSSQALSNFDLKLSKDTAFTTSCGRLFQLFMTLILKKCFTYCSLNEWFIKFKVMAPCPGFVDHKQIWDWLSPQRILYTKIISPRILQYLMLGTLIAAKRSWYGLSESPGINFVETFSISSSSFLRSRYPIETQYSKCCLTKELNKWQKCQGECKNV